MRILVTGGAGYIGSHAVRWFLQHGHDVLVYDNLSTGHAAAVPPSRLTVGELADEAALQQAFNTFAPDAVVHFAAVALVGESFDNPRKYYETNLACSQTLLRVMLRAGVHRLVFSSTCATYGIPAQHPLTEAAPTLPISPYGRTKLAVEWMLRDYAAAYGLAFAALRYFNAAGADPQGDLGEDHQPETHLIPCLLLAALDRRPPVPLLGDDYPTPDGTCIRDFVHVNDLAAAHLLALEQLKPNDALIYNLGTGQGASVRSVVETCQAVTGRRIPCEIAPRRPGDPPQLVAAADKARRELNWQPAYTDLQAIIETAWRWHRDHPRGFGG